MILGKMVIQLSKEPSQRLLKHVVSGKFNIASKMFTFEQNHLFGRLSLYSIGGLQIYSANDIEKSLY